jgi:hypothetical protein
LQAIAHGLTCYHGNLESIDLAGRSFKAVTAAALHCYYSDLHTTDDLWEYLSTTKEKLLDEHKQKNLVTAEGNEIIPAAYLNLDLNKHLNPWEDTSTVNSQPNMMVLNPESQDEATTESATETLPQQTTISPNIELLIITVVKQLERLISAMFLDTAFAMEQHKRKKRAEQQTATIVKKSATLNMGNEITQALAGEPPVTHAIMASLIDERIKTHEKQSAKLIATEARKKSSGGGGTNPKHPDKQQEKTGQKRNGSLKHTNPSKKPRRSYIPPWQLPQTQHINPYMQPQTPYRTPVYQPFHIPTPPPFPYPNWHPTRGRGRGSGRTPQRGRGRGRGSHDGSSNVYPNGN